MGEALCRGEWGRHLCQIPTTPKLWLKVGPLPCPNLTFSGR